MAGVNVKFSCMAAMLDESRGIGYKNKLPWPHIKKDYDYYTSLTNFTKDPNKKAIHIMGRSTWESIPEQYLPNKENVITIVLSRTLSETPKHCQHLARNFQEAVEKSKELQDKGQGEAIWIMGGHDVYAEAMAHPGCEKVYLTRIYADFPSDAFYPKFEDNYHISSESELLIQDDNDIKLKFFVYEPNS